MPGDLPNDVVADGPGETVRLDKASIDAIARQVAEILRAEPVAMAPQLITAADVATRFGVSRTWVYDNAERLGAVRLGSGSRARLRFDPDRVREHLRASADRRPAGRSAPPPRWLSEADLIPIRGH